MLGMGMQCIGGIDIEVGSIGVECLKYSRSFEECFAVTAMLSFLIYVTVYLL